MPATDTAPRWAGPFLAVHFVATSRSHRLRQLDDTAFRRTARACDQFILGTTVPGFVASALTLPGAFAPVPSPRVFLLWDRGRAGNRPTRRDRAESPRQPTPPHLAGLTQRRSWYVAEHLVL